MTNPFDNKSLVDAQKKLKEIEGDEGIDEEERRLRVLQFNTSFPRSKTS